MPDLSVSSQGALSRTWRLQKIVSNTLASTFRLRKMGPEATFQEVSAVSKAWGAFCCEHVGMRQEIEGQPLLDEPCLYVANHVSYLDIVFLMSILPVTFIAKKEVAEWPVFGAGATAAGTVYINRTSNRSRLEVSQTMGRAITQEKKSIGLFPEGTSSINVKPWKKGAFKVAHDYGFKVQPVRIFYNPLRTAAFIDDDSLMPHLWKLLGLNQLEASIRFFPPETITNPEKDCARMEDMVRRSFHEKLAQATPNDL